MNTLKDQLLEGNYSCVIRNNGVTKTFTQPGVRDLMMLLNTDSGFLNGASMADKIVGKAAAALMILGGVKELYAETISQPAIDFLREAGIQVSYSESVPFIKNRDNTGMCPMENLSLPLQSPIEIKTAIEDFIKRMMAKSNN